MKGAIDVEQNEFDLDLLRDSDAEEETAPEQEAEIFEEKMAEENIEPIHLDYKLKTCEERTELVRRIVESTPKERLTTKYLEILGDYIMGGISKEEKREKLYLTDNRLITINKRETSFEGLAEKFENGEDGIYNLISTNSKNIILQPKQEITQEDIDTIPGMKALTDDMKRVEEAGKSATGRRKYLLKKQLIEMRKDRFILKSIFKPTAHCGTTSKGLHKIDLSETRYVDENGDPQSTGLISFFNEKHVAAILQYYGGLKLETEGHYWDDFYYMLNDFDKLVRDALKDYPRCWDIFQMKIDNKSNAEIQQLFLDKYKEVHTPQYISSIWCNKIPKLIAEKAQNDFLIWYYKNVEQGTWKRCSCCHEWKLASPRFFTRNKTSKDGFYSLCKECRKKKSGQN